MRQYRKDYNDRAMSAVEEELINDLAPLESFDREVFSNKGKSPTRLKEFILSVALFCNDLKDIILMKRLVADLAPSNTEKELITTKLGQYSGLNLHLGRLYISQINELAVLLKESSDVFELPEFKEVLRKLPERSRNHWAELHDILVLNKDLPKSEFRSILAITRNKIAFHYDGGELRVGYEKQFMDHDNEPYVSRGDLFRQNRFYFADGAAETYLNRTVAQRKSVDYTDMNNALAESIYLSLFPMVTIFINTYSSWQKPKKSKTSEFDIPKYGGLFDR